MLLQTHETLAYRAEYNEEYSMAAGGPFKGPAGTPVPVPDKIVFVLVGFR